MGGVSWALECFSCGHNSRTSKKKKPIRTVELKVGMDCQGCELKLRKALSSMKGVKSLSINRKQHKVTVIGSVDPRKVLDRARSTGNRAEIWPFVPYYSALASPHFAEAYNGAADGQHSKVQEDHHNQISHMFSDDNPNACTIM